jgi:hypothetical protein
LDFTTHVESTSSTLYTACFFALALLLGRAFPTGGGSNDVDVQSLEKRFGTTLARLGNCLGDVGPVLNEADIRDNGMQNLLFRGNSPKKPFSF